MLVVTVGVIFIVATSIYAGVADAADLAAVAFAVVALPVTRISSNAPGSANRCRSKTFCTIPK